MKIHAYTPYPAGLCRLEVIGTRNGKRRLIKSDILPYDLALQNLKEKVLTNAVGLDILPTVIEKGDI